jgi:hypothetical protein
MKDALLLSTFLLIASFLSIFGQDNKNLNRFDGSHSPWSVSFSYSPHYAFSFNPPDNSQQYNFFLLGFNGRVDRKINSERVSISFGVNLRNKYIDYYNPDRQEKVTLIEFPFQVNYHLKKTVDNFDPYIKSSLRICCFKSNYYGNSQPSIIGGIVNTNYIDYLPLLDIGYGSFLRIYNNLNLLLESNLGYGLTNILPNRAYFDLLIGIKFNL